MTEAQIAAQDKADRDEMLKFFIIIMIAISVVMGLAGLVAWYIAWYWTNPSEVDPLTIFVGKAWGGGKALMQELSKDPVGWAKGKVQVIRATYEL